MPVFNPYRYNAICPSWLQTLPEMLAVHVSFDSEENFCKQ